MEEEGEKIKVRRNGRRERKREIGSKKERLRKREGVAA